jgi:hypothetical protein
MAAYIVNVDGTLSWRFPNDGRLDGIDRLPALRGWDDSERLVERGDFFGMLAILALLREAAAQSRYDDIRRHTKNLYRSLPAVMRLSWVRPDVDLLLQCIEQVKTIRFYPFRIALNWEAFRAQILAPMYEPNPRFWERDPVTQEFVNKPADLMESDPENWHERPVPLLPGVEPLEPYIIRPKAKTETPQPRRRSFALGLGLKPIFGPLANRSATDDGVPSSSEE